MIEETQSYPITIVAGVSRSVSTRLAAAGVVTAKQIAYGDATTIAHDADIPLKEVLLIAGRARAILEA